MHLRDIFKKLKSIETKLNFLNWTTRMFGLGTLRKLNIIEQKLDEVLTPKPSAKKQNGYINEVQGRRRSTNMRVTVPALKDVEKVLLSVMPRGADGKVDTAASPAWTSDSDQIGVEPGTEAFEFADPQFPNDPPVTCPGNFNCWALTPGSTGDGNVTSKVTGYEDEVFGPIHYEPGVARKQNGSVGSPVADTEISPA